MARIQIAARSFCNNPELVAEAREALREHEVHFASGSSDLLGEELIAFLADAEGAIIGREPIDAPLLGKLKHLRAIAKYGVGLDNLDLEALQRQNVALLLSPGVNAQPVAEHTIGLILAALRQIALNDRLLHQGVWRKNGGTTLLGKTVGIIGCGAVGSALARMLSRGFQCRILINDIEDRTAIASEVNGQLCSYDAIFPHCDVISFHVPLTQQTFRMFGAKQIERCLKHALIVNTARGEIFDYPALFAALQSGGIAAAGLDVFDDEPIPDPQIRTLDNLVATPHTAGNAHEAVMAMGRGAITRIQEFFS